MPAPTNTSLRTFLDIEAEVDDIHDTESEEDEEDVEFQNAFIDDTVDSDETNTRSLKASVNAIPLDSEREARLEIYYEDLLARVRDKTHPLSYGNDTDYETVRDQKITDSICRNFSEDDAPLWRVKCRLGVEDILVAFLFSAATDEHGLHSAFTRGSIRGFVYLECDMNASLLALLEKSPGVIRTRLGIIHTRIDPLDCVNLLRMENANTVNIGDWVRVNRGTYKGDIGLVHDTRNWGLNVLLVPRISYSSERKGKRKSSRTQHPAKLFDPKYLESLSATSYEDGSYVVRNTYLTHGLAQKTFDYHSVTGGITDIPWAHFSMFLTSGHPHISMSNLPKPAEWKFTEDDSIIIRDSGKRGVIQSIANNYVEFHLYDEGSHRAGWWDIQKDIKIGDFVSVKGGSHSGYEGWVIEINDHNAKVAERFDNTSLNAEVSAIEVHINCLVRSEPPFQLIASPSPTNIHKRAVVHGWCGTNVLVTKQHHPRKGNLFQIIGVLEHQPTSSGLRLEVQYQHFSVYTPFQKMTLDYDDIVESSTLLPLLEFFNVNQSREVVIRRPHIPENESSSNNGNTTSAWKPATPMPQSTNTLDGTTWDISAKSPVPYPDTTFQQNTSTAIPLPTACITSQETGTGISTAHSQTDSSGKRSTSINAASGVIDVARSNQPVHVLLDRLFVDLKLNVIINGGSYKKKEMVAHVSNFNNQLVLRYIARGTSHTLQPEWVTPKYPNAAHDNGLLVIIKGEHRGKFVRRLHHQHTGSVSTMTLAVINRQEHAPHTINEERLTLATDFLCTVFETKEERDRNKNLTQALRDSHRKRRKV